ncbi:NfeD family protein [Campylobacter gastrosuis]|uniref:NfeD family protein n=1 Tax=Campylobacter gastrosuis TaxID=2974576 RepID=A0ABT7HLN4_9BACT|nr:NfeD family protein [Campylobacter gastrosuis]MDL0087884.1 NfeD family protein [Campylobacter gastrosuis]MDL0088095.1 NfeD family protein [Campylobacter gastrosuis]
MSFLIAGICLILAELMFGSFYLLFCGLGFLATGILSFFIDFSWYFGLILSAIFSIILIFALKKPFKKSQKNEIKDDFLNERGFGVIKNDMVYFKGTFWHFDEGLKSKLKDGDRVEILSTKDNFAVIKF